MFNWQSIKVLIAAVLLVGCTSTPPKSLPIYHPPLPEPYKTCEHIEWKYMVYDDKYVYPTLSYQDGIDFSLCRDDMIRYLEEATQIIKHYRNPNKKLQKSS